MNDPIHIELYPIIAKDGNDNYNSYTTFQRERALKSATKLERILMEEHNDILRNRIIEIAKEKNLYCDISDRSDYYFRMLTSIPGMRKFDGWKVFPAALLNYYDTSHSRQSFFFYSQKELSPRLEIIKLGTQPCYIDDQRKKIPFLFFRIGVSKELNMGLYHLKTIGMSYKNLVTKVDAKVLQSFAFNESFSFLIGKTLNFKVDELRPDEVESTRMLPQVQYTGNGTIYYKRQPFGTKDNLFGFYTQHFVSAERPFFDQGYPMAIRYDHNKNYNRKFVVWAKKLSYPVANTYNMSITEELYIHDIYITVDTLAHEEPPPYEEGEDKFVESGGLFSSMPDKSQQKVIVDLGSDRYLCTTVEILETMVGNRLHVETPNFELPQRDKNLADWWREKQESWFPRKYAERKVSDLVLPS